MTKEDETMDDVDIDGALQELIDSGEVEQSADEATGEPRFRLTAKGMAAAAALVKEMTEAKA